MPAKASMSVPEVLTNGLPEPSSAAPIVWMAPRSAADRAREVARAHRLVLEGQVDDAVGLGGCLAQAVEVVQVAAADLGAGRRERGRRAVGTGQADDLMPGPQQLGDDRGADVSGRTGDEDAHGEPPS